MVGKPRSPTVGADAIPASRSDPRRSRRTRMFSSADEVIAFIKKEGVTFVDVRFCDLPGVMQHFNLPAVPAGRLKCCITPGRSQNRTSTNVTPSFLMKAMTSSAELNIRVLLDRRGRA